MSQAMATDLRACAQQDRPCDRLSRAAVFRMARGLQEGEVTIIERGEEHCFQGSANPLGLRCTIHVHNSRFYKRFILGGSIGAGEAYMAGWWSCDDIATLTRILARNSQLYAGLDSGWARLAVPLYTALHWLQANTLRGSRRNIAAHYDLGNSFFSLFLDPTMAYSAAIFPSPASTLEEASIAKFDRICQKLELNPHDHLLEIGTGWGGFAVHAAQHYGCRVTTTTISREQHEAAVRRVQDAGLADKVTVLQEDYRNLRGQYDKLVSIEMIEAVGWEFLPTYFGQCSSLLKPEGRMVLQGITTTDQGYDTKKRQADFINRYIFPGGCLPSVGAIMQAVGSKTDFRLLHLEDNAPHYALTLLRWREAFREKVAAVREQGFDDAFIRMWDFYLSLCAGAFAEGRIGSVQMVLAKPHCRASAVNLPPLANVELT